MEKTKFSNLINNLAVTAEKDKWIPKYDKKLDYFFWTKKSVNKNAVLVKVSHETSLYVNPSGKIEGVFVEYLKNNFVEHNPSYRGFVNEFTKQIDENIYELGNDKKAEKYLFGFGQALRADIYQDAQEKGDIDFDGLVQYALTDNEN